MLEGKKIMLQTTTHSTLAPSTPIHGDCLKSCSVQGKRREYKWRWAGENNFDNLFHFLPFGSFPPISCLLKYGFHLGFFFFFGLFICLVLFRCHIFDQLFIKGQFCRYLWRLWKKKTSLEEPLRQSLNSYSNSCPLFFLPL